MKKFNPSFLYKNNIYFYLFLSCSFTIKFFLFFILFDPSIAKLSFNFINEPSSENTLFPYGITFYLIYSVISFFENIIEVKPYLFYICFMLLFDIWHIILLKKFYISKANILLYLISPILYLPYIYGWNDYFLLPFLITSFYYFREREYAKSLIFLGILISFKPLFILLAPIYFICSSFFLDIKKLNNLLLSSIIFFLLIISFHLFVPDSLKSIDIVIDNNVNIAETFPIFSFKYFFIFYIFFLYYLSQIKKYNFLIFSSSCVLVLFYLFITNNLNIGWLVWSYPFLFINALKNGYVPKVFLLFLNISIIYSFSSYSFLLDLIHDYLYVSLLLVMLFNLFKASFVNSDFSKYADPPYLISIAGDSSSGKDTLSDALQNILIKGKSISISGDNYHKWDRGMPMWSIMTHLDPKANNLDQYKDDIFNLKSRKNIVSQNYQHGTGKMTLSFLSKSNEFILASGLHALYDQEVVKASDLNIYLDIDEGLRRFLKIKRDTKKRNQEKKDIINSIEKRVFDGKKYIHPQKKYADIIFKVCPANDSFKLDSAEEPKLKLEIYTNYRLPIDSLKKTIIGICGLYMDIDSNNEYKYKITIEGESSPDDMIEAATMLDENFLNFIDKNPIWYGGNLGIMQLITLLILKSKIS